MKYCDYQQVTRRKTLLQPIEEQHLIFHLAQELLGEVELGDRPVRLLGIAISNLEAAGVKPTEEQLVLELSVNSNAVKQLPADDWV